MGGFVIYPCKSPCEPDLDGGGEDLHGEILHNPLIYMGRFVISPCKSKKMDIYEYIDVYICIYIYIYIYKYVYAYV